MLSLQILINIFILLHVTPIIVKREFLIVKCSTLIGFSQILYLLIGVLMTWKDGYYKKAIKKRKCGNKYWEVEQFVETIFWTEKGLSKKKHRLHLIWLIFLFLKMLGKSLKNYTFNLYQTKLIRGFSQKYLLLVLKTPRVLRTT